MKRANAGGAYIIPGEILIHFLYCRSQCRRSAVEITTTASMMVEILLCHALEHLSPFSRLVTRVTSHKSIDSLTSSV